MVFLLEEQSAEEMLKGVLPGLLGKNTRFLCIPFEGKRDLEGGLGVKLRGWLESDTCFVVLHDQDNADCHKVKQKLVKICQDAGKPDALVRIVCRELESWFLGDLAAVEKGLGMHGIAKQQQKSKFRNPDKLSNAKQELKKLTRNRYRQISGARNIGGYMSLENNRSASFNIFIAGIRRLLNQQYS